MALTDGHSLEKWYHLRYCGPQLHHVGAPYEQCRDRSNGISIFSERDVNGNYKAGLSVLAENSFEFDPTILNNHMHHSLSLQAHQVEAS